MFGTALLTAGTLLQLHVSWRALTLPWLRRPRRRRLALWMLLGLYAALVLGRVWGHHHQGALPRALEWLGMNWLATLFLVEVGLVVVELGTLFGLIFRRHAPWLRAGAMGLGCALAGVALVQGHRAPVVERYAVELPSLPTELDGITLVALSDLHVGDQVGPGWLAARVAQVQALQPDLVVLLGDLLEGSGKPSTALVPVLQGLSARLGVFAVSGNHDAEESLAILQQAGVQVLRDRWVEPAPGLIVAGVDDGRRGGQGEPSVLAALQGRPPSATILLSHRPDHAARAAALGIGLMLSGHTHGGQLWPFGVLVAQVDPLLQGRYHVDGMTVLVSRGAGTWGPRMRLWAPGLILQVTLRSGASPPLTASPRRSWAPRAAARGPGSRRHAAARPPAAPSSAPPARRG